MTDKTIDLNSKILEKKISDFWKSVEGVDHSEITNYLLLEIMMQVIQINARFSAITDTIRAANDTDSSREISERTAETQAE